VAVLGLAARAVGPVSPDPYNGWQFVIGLSAVGIGTFVGWKRPDHPMGLVLLAAGLAVWATFATKNGLDWLFTHHPGQEQLGRAILAVGISGWIVCRGIMVCLVPQAFPDGFSRHHAARALRWASVTIIAATALAHARVNTIEHFMGQPSAGLAATAEDLLPWGHRAILVCGALAVADLVWRTVRADPAVRRQHQWFVAATLALELPLVLGMFDQFVVDLEPALDRAELWVSALLPVVLAVGILRHGLLDISVVVRRATLLTLVSLVLAALYAVTVAVAATVTPDGSVLPAFIGAGVIAVSFSQVRGGVERLVARRLFGSRDDPYLALAALGSRVEAAPPSEKALQTVTDTICEELRIPWAAVDLDLDDGPVRVALTGIQVAGGEAFALQHRGVDLGRLLVGRRTPEEAFSDGEHRLLAALARQAGVLAHNATLTEALRRSRIVLLNAREEERRRIRADLHDGLGPTLATVALGLGAAGERLAADDDLGPLLGDLERELQTAIADVRALVYDLRPAALDDLGLVTALRRHAEAVARRTADSSRPLSVEVDAPETLPVLPAAVEVAAYRVALEALTNVARHARASWCGVALDTDELGLALTVADDGIGPGGDRFDPGVGVASMRERVEELGGRFRIEPRPGSGTVIRAWMPLPAPVPG